MPSTLRSRSACHFRSAAQAASLAAPLAAALAAQAASVAAQAAASAAPLAAASAGGPGGGPGGGQLHLARLSIGVLSRHSDCAHAVGMRPNQMHHAVGTIGGEEPRRAIGPGRECRPRDPRLSGHDLVPIIDPVLAIDLCGIDRWAEPFDEMLLAAEMISALAGDEVSLDRWHPGTGEIPGILAAVAAGTVQIQDFVQRPEVVIHAIFPSALTYARGSGGREPGESGGYPHLMGSSPSSTRIRDRLLGADIKPGDLAQGDEDRVLVPFELAQLRVRNEIRMRAVLRIVGWIKNPTIARISLDPTPM